MRGALRSQGSCVRVPPAAQNLEAREFPHCLPWCVPAFPPNLPRAQGPLVFLPGNGEGTRGAGSPVGGIFLSPSPSPSFLLLFPRFISILPSSSRFIFFSTSFHFFPFLPSSLQLIPFFFEAFSPHPLPLSLPSIARWRPGPLPCTSRLSHERCQHHLASASNITLFLTKERKNIRIQRNHPCL